MKVEVVYKEGMLCKGGRFCWERAWLTKMSWGKVRKQV
jgi:hypothetical protein